MNPTETWILENLRPTKTTSARLISDRSELQSGGQLVGIYQEPTPENTYHWRDTAICEAFAVAVCGTDRVIMDVGPGDGWPSLIIAPRCAKIIGIDPSDKRVGVQRGNAQRLGISNCEFRNMDIQDLAFPDNTFDGAVAASSIEQADDPIKGLTEIYRVLKPGAKLAMTFEKYDDEVDTNSEEVCVEISESEYLLSYLVCESKALREARYAIWFDHSILQNNEIRQIVNSIQASGSTWLADHSLIELLRCLQTSIVNSCYYELHHFSLRSLGNALAKIGFTDIRGFGCDINSLMPFAEFAITSGIAQNLKETFMQVSSYFGAASVRFAKSGVGDFTIATKPI
ncbi:class I SAM-dependent methyltransferase [bacterium]|nr:class I SAM-dependent methyltransferase [bacterium]